MFHQRVSRSGLVAACVLTTLASAPSAAVRRQAFPARAPAPGTAGAVARPASADPATAIDRLFAAAVKPGDPAMTVIVVKDGKTLFRKAYGLANLELQVPARPEMVFRIGSVTKQFTAAAILMLVEQGKLALTDDITKVLPDYPTQGKTITIEHLLTHTSGIQSYTDMPAWPPLAMKDLTPAELVDFFKKEPLQFDPGTRWRYNNSGYFLLGVVIEKVSGQKYAEFLKQRIFDRAGMTHTFYGGTGEIIPGRVGLYARSGDRFVNAEYISMTQPFSAGALVSSVDDLATWNAALDSGRVISKASLAKMFTAYLLKSGQSTGYGYGWALGHHDGHAVQEHGGGIPGGRAEVLRLPDAGIYVAVLSNLSAPAPDPGVLGRKAAAIAMGTPIVEPTPVTLAPDVLDRYTGVFLMPDQSTREVRRDGAKLLWVAPGGASELRAVKEDEFFLRADAFRRFRFTVDPATGKASRITIDDWAGSDVARRTDRPAAKERTAVKLAPAIFDALAGEYQLAPTFSIVVTREGDHLMAQATGQPKFELFPESEKEYFLRVVDAQVSFVKEPSGHVTGLVLHQGGQDVPGKKLQK
jgi:D-alanyl-D-alanine carboxypeptidase